MVVVLIVGIGIFTMGCLPPDPPNPEDMEVEIEGKVKLTTDITNNTTHQKCDYIIESVIGVPYFYNVSFTLIDADGAIVYEKHVVDIIIFKISFKNVNGPKTIVDVGDYFSLVLDKDYSGGELRVYYDDKEVDVLDLTPG